MLSNPRKKDGPAKVKVRPLLVRQQLMFQIETFENRQAFHRNVDAGEACALLEEYMENMRQMQMETTESVFTVLVSKKGRATVKRKAQKDKGKETDMSHNRKKRYILEEGMPVPFLEDLGVIQSVLELLWQLLASGKVDDLNRAVVPGIPEQQNLKVRARGVSIDAALFQGDRAIGLNIDCKGFHVAAVTSLSGLKFESALLQALMPI